MFLWLEGFVILSFLWGCCSVLNSWRKKSNFRYKNGDFCYFSVHNLKTCLALRHQSLNFFLTFFNFLHTVLFRYPVVIKGEFGHRSRVPSAGDHILYSRDHNVWWKQCGEIQLSGVKGSRHFVCLNVPSNSAVSSVVPKSLYAVSYLPPRGRNKEEVFVRVLQRALPARLCNVKCSVHHFTILFDISENKNEG